MTGLTILLLALAGLVLVAALAAAYARELRIWKETQRQASTAAQEAKRSAEPASLSLGTATAETAEVGVGEFDAIGHASRRTSPSDVFRYTIRRPEAAVRKKMPDLGGFAEVPLRLYDQLGNRFTVHQKVRLN